MVNIPVFLDRVPQGFYDRLLATKPEPGTGKPNPQRLAAFLAKYPETARAMKTIAKTPPTSGIYNSTFHGLNAFWFTNSAGRTVPVRWLMVPELPAEPATGPQPHDHDYLFDGLIRKFVDMGGALRWHLVLTIGEPGDPTNDATTAWPPDRRTIDAGTLTIDSLQTEAAGNARDVNFDPTVLPDGIAVSDDPLLSARSAVYFVSFTRRSREPKEPSEVNVTEVERDL
jgi:catalase